MKIIKSHSAGFTLIEALITISIAAILASIAVPSFTSMVEDNRVSAASNEFLAALILARSEAAKRSQTVSICTSSDGTSCSSTLDDYAKGWLVFTDCDEDGDLDTAATTCDLDGDGTFDADRILRVQDALKNMSIVANQAASEDFYSYELSGRGSGVLTFDIGPDATTKKHEITVAVTGRAKSTKVD